MDIEKIINAIKNELAKGKLRDSIQLFLELVKHTKDEEAEKELIVFQSRYSSLKRRGRLDLLSYEEYDRSTSKLTLSLLDLLEQIGSIDKKDAIDRFGKTTKSRTEIIVKRAREIYEIYGEQVIRQRAINTSFSLPNRDLSDPIWEKWNRDKYYDQLKDERYWLEKHLQGNYGKLIIKPSERTMYKIDDPEYSVLRLKILHDFIETNKERIDVVCIPESIPFETKNLTIVGEKFFAESVSRKDESWHDTSISSQNVKEKIEEFDQEFYELLNKQGLDVFSSRQRTLENIKKEITRLEMFYKQTEL